MRVERSLTIVRWTPPDRTLFNNQTESHARRQCSRDSPDTRVYGVNVGEGVGVVKGPRGLGEALEGQGIRETGEGNAVMQTQYSLESLYHICWGGVRDELPSAVTIIINHVWQSAPP